MNENSLKLNPNRLVAFLEKPASEFTKADLLRAIEHFEIEMIHFRYMAHDGKLKTLNFVINSLEHADEVLTSGERVDGSSLFPFLEAGSSDLYVIPRFRTAFIDPFAMTPTLDVLCNFYTKDGKPFEMAPEYTLHKAGQAFREATGGMEFEAMGELEYYVIADKDELYKTENQKGYHASTPFCKFEEFRAEAMRMIAQSGGLIKYGHSEVGNFMMGDKMYEQNEIEFLPTQLEDAADQLVIAKWIMRTLAWENYGMTVTFAPKITVGKAGSGMHIHTRVSKEGKNMYIDEKGERTEVAYKTIAGILNLAGSLTAFGDTNPTSYFRLVPHQEAPTNICWGDRNRSAMVRVPLGWTKGCGNMMADCNPLEKKEEVDFSHKQTIELRTPDGSANVYLLLAGMAVAARHGFEMKDAVQYAKDRYVSVNIFEHDEVLKKLDTLPDSCAASADLLERDRATYEAKGVFAPPLIDATIKELRSYDDRTLRKDIGDNASKILSLVEAYLHCG
ncbi:MAG: glutamine synthetase family protein [Bacteroidales bacterium]|nr:glutamine synthetase family protein [Bacteroidales bacterium]